MCHSQEWNDEESFEILADHDDKNKLNMKEILIIEQDSKLQELMRSRFARQGGLRTAFVSVKEEALSRIEQDSFAAIVLDLRGANEQEADFLKNIRNIHEAAHIPVIITIPKCDISFLVYLMNLGATEYLFRPYDFDELLAIIRRYI